MKQGIPPAWVGTQAHSGKSSRWILFISSLLLGLVLVGSLLTGFFTDAARSAAQRDRAKLDQTMTEARTTMFVPESLLAPIVQSEQHVASVEDGTIFGYQSASASYVRLTRQTLDIEQMSPAQARAMTQSDLTAFSAGVDTIVKGNYVEAAGYQTRLKQAQSSFAAAATTTDFFKVDSFAQDQAAALKLFKPTLDRLNAFTKQANAMAAVLNGPSTAVGPAPLQCALGNDYSYWVDDPAITLPGATSSASTLTETQWAQSDLTAFRNATTEQQYVDLNQLLITHAQQAQANEINLLPTVTANVLKTFQTDITTAQAQHVDVTASNKLYTADEQQAQTIAATPTIAAYTTLLANIRKHDQALELPVLKAKTAADVQTLKKLVAQGQASTTLDFANGNKYPNAYEYADPSTGIGDATARLANAQTLADYQAVDAELQSFIHNITAMLTNLTQMPKLSSYSSQSAFLNGVWAWSQKAHQTDLDLLNYYDIQNTKVIVVSLREQVARFYDSGKLVKALQVTTGAADLPSIPGMHCVQYKQTNTIFKSPDPPTSPNYYQPTPIHFAMYYSDYGYELHDAWWRNSFGYQTNLPHYDPAAFNGGSHGCVNFNYWNGDAAWMYNWSSDGTPVVIY